MLSVAVLRRVRSRRVRVALGLALLPFAAPGLSGAAGAAPVETAETDGMLAVDEAWFWEGPTVDGRVPAAELCGVAVDCPVWTVHVAPGGARLRAGIETADREDTFVVEVLDPSGTLVASDSNSNQFHSEAFVDAPSAGDWTVRVRPQAVTRANFRVRVRLESAAAVAPRSGAKVPLLPNLRTVPPYEFTFTAPANPLNGLYPPDTVNPPLEAAGVSPVSCSADESAPAALGGAGAVDCLRFTSGPVNLGPGIYDKRFRLVDDTAAGKAAPNADLERIVVGPMTQVVHWSDGGTTEHPGGTYSFHPAHGHFHDDYVLTYDLFRVADPVTGRLERAGKGNKSGFCPADQLWADWYAFNQGYETPGGDSPFDNCFSPTDGTVGLSTGWGDVYRWQRPGQYVEFAGNGNGRYVVNATVDATGTVLETDDTDNVSYAYIEVHDRTVRVLERGWGRSPWDGRKVLFPGAGPLDRLLTAEEAVRHHRGVTPDAR